MPLELSTAFKAISTSPRKSGGGLSPKAAAAKAKSNLRYITRDGAAEAGEVISFGLDRAAVKEAIGRGQSYPKAQLAAMRAAIDDSAEAGGKRGKRVAEKLMVSLPNDWPPEAQREALKRVALTIAPPYSEAVIIGAIHRDKKHNTHMHFLAIDGLETPESARARAQQNPDAKRVRRRQAIRLGDMGRPGELRAEIAATLNGIAAKRGLSQVEWRSFKARGVEQEPGTHRGPDKPRKRPQKAQEAPASPIPQQVPTLPPAPTPEARKRVYRNGRWITLRPGEESAPKRRRQRGDDER